MRTNRQDHTKTLHHKLNNTMNAIIILIAAPFCNVLAFSVNKHHSINYFSRPKAVQKQGELFAEYPEEKFERAVNCASNFGFCNIDELEELAESLDEYKSCIFEAEKDPNSCEKEIQDKEDIAEVLRMQKELRLRMDYVKNANLFADDVTSNHDEHVKEMWDGVAPFQAY